MRKYLFFLIMCVLFLIASCVSLFAQKRNPFAKKNKDSSPLLTYIAQGKTIEGTLTAEAGFLKTLKVSGNTSKEAFGSVSVTYVLFNDGTIIHTTPVDHMYMIAEKGMTLFIPYTDSEAKVLIENNLRKNKK